MVRSVWFTSGLSLVPLVAAGGDLTCPCVTPAKNQTAATGKPAFVTGSQYGYGCKAQNLGKGACAAANDTADGQPNDWCPDKWCIVDPKNCKFKTRGVSYTAAMDDFFSYETCDPTKFKGNSWVGTVACKDKANSFCTAAANIAMAGDASCPCVLPAKTQTAATGKPAFVTGSHYGYGCKAQNLGKGACATANDTADGQPNDWCPDKWCIVDPNNCKFKTRHVSYTMTTDDHFSYETCDPTKFKGNSWVGTVACKDKANSFCTAAANTAMAAANTTAANNTTNKVSSDSERPLLFGMAMGFTLAAAV